MNHTRREFMATMVGAFGAAAIIMATPSRARACMYGTWIVRCPKGHDDEVTEGTCQHVCEKCGTQVFSGNVVTVVCTKGHANRVDTGDRMTSWKCSNCGTECRRDSEQKSRRDPPDRGRPLG